MAGKDEGMTSDTERRFADALEQMAAGLGKIADAMVIQAETNASLTKGMYSLTTTIRGAHEVAADHLKKNFEAGEKRRAELGELSRKMKNGEVIVSGS
jgi:hypothetical protein